MLFCIAVIFQINKVSNKYTRVHTKTRTRGNDQGIAYFFYELRSSKIINARCSNRGLRSWQLLKKGSAP
jgi:hypothetical protein